MTNSPNLDTFLKQFRSILYRRKERIVFPGENTDNLYYILQGYVTQSILSPNGNQFTPYIFAPKAFFPLIWREDNEAPNIHDYEYETLTPVEVYKIPKETMLSFFKENPDIAVVLNEQLKTYSAGLLNKLETRIFGKAINTVSLILIDLAKLSGNGQREKVIINYWFTHQDIANISGLAREVVTRQMNMLTEKKLISYKNHFIVINDLHALESESIA
jgi:CRP-like cAMP-binding protein